MGKDKKKIQVVAAVIQKERKILIAKRSNSGVHPSLWEFPGGKVEEGETLKEALKREIKEELDCWITVGDFIDESMVFTDTLQIEMAVFEAIVQQGEPRKLEHAELRWIEIHELECFTWAPADIPLLESVSRYFKGHWR